MAKRSKAARIHDALEAAGLPIASVCVGENGSVELGFGRQLSEAEEASAKLLMADPQQWPETADDLLADRVRKLDVRKVLAALVDDQLDGRDAILAEALEIIRG